MSSRPPKEPRSSKPDEDKKKSLRVLSTSLGIVLAANLTLASQVHGESSPSPSAAASQPKLVEWSTDQVKAFYDPKMDWNIPYPGQTSGANSPQPSSGTGQTTSGGSTVVVNNGFGWSDILLYHMLFNSGRAYSTTQWQSQNPVFDPRTNQPYQPKTFNSGTFQNKPVVNSVIRPKTTKSSGTFSTNSSSKSTSASKGSIGGKSSGFGSSSRSSGGSFGG